MGYHDARFAWKHAGLFGGAFDESGVQESRGAL